MKLIGKQNLIKVGSNMKFFFLNSGDIYQIMLDHLQINMYRGNLVDGGHSNIYLCIENEKPHKLIGVASPSVFYQNNGHVSYRGELHDVSYQLDLIISPLGWQYKFRVLNETNKKASLIYLQDVGLADVNAILNSEAYIAQYIDHHFVDEALVSTQNQGLRQSLKFTASEKITSYATDGLDFFGLGYKYSGVPDYLDKDLPSRQYQGESSYIAIKTEKVNLNKKTITFNVKYNDNELLNLDLDVMQLQAKKPKIYKLLNGLKVSKPNHEKTHHEETGLSYFTIDHAHVVLQEKELIQQRSTGSIIVAGDATQTTNLASSTTWMNGIFNSHVVFGNTNFNKFLSVNRNQIVPSSITGQRIWLKYEGSYQLLNMPTYFEMGLNYSKWTYHLKTDILEITSYTGINPNKIHLIFNSTNKINYELIITQQIMMNINEDDSEIYYEEKPYLTFFPAKGSQMEEVCPNLKFRLETAGYEIVRLHDLDLPNVVAFKYYDNEIKLTIKAINGKLYNSEDVSFAKAKKEKMNLYDNFINHLEIKGDQDINRYNHLLYWYTHNALVHYAQPHGLEQYNGAAWGTRDVCQGPLELFMSFGHFKEMRKIILKVFSNQYYSENGVMDGDFPQWFMFDEYHKIRARDSHADIIIWPLLVLGEYLEKTNDQEILEEVIPYVDYETLEKVFEEPLIAHLERLINNLKKNQIPNTVLPKYGGGDWNDTLQPANKDLTEQMVSSWTTALLYQALDILAVNLKGYPLFKNQLIMYKNELQKDYLNHLYIDKNPAGFVIFNSKKDFLFHPNETLIGIKHRLIAYNQAITSAIINEEDIPYLHDVVETNLKFPDGYHLMERPVKYQGGEKRYFQRAETATNFGREIGTMYVHAHLRRIEALLLTGEASLAYDAFNVVNPINLSNYLTTAEPRQANVYFSSSDANFLNRYAAQENYDQAKNNEISFKGGWRIYSSGPGIYLHQFVANFIGIKAYSDKLQLVPTIPKSLSGLEVSFKIANKTVKIKYLSKQEKSLMFNETIINPQFGLYGKRYYEIAYEAMKNSNQIIIYY